MSAQNPFHFTTAEDFVPPPFSATQIDAINQTFNPNHYTAAPLITGDVRERLFGGRSVASISGTYVCGGFAVQTMRPDAHDVASEALVAPPPGQTDFQFLELCVDMLTPALPNRQDFPVRPAEISRSLAALGLTAAATVYLGIQQENPDIAFCTLIFPRIYLTDFRNLQDPEPAYEFGTKLGAGIFKLLASADLQTPKTLRTKPDNKAAE